VTADQVVEALRRGEFESVRSAATDGFREHISADEMARVWTEMERSLGALRTVGAGVVLHDVALHCERGDAHLQVAYQDGVISGLVLRDGVPTGRFGE
jgi:hypothetical protein